MGPQHWSSIYSRFRPNSDYARIVGARSDTLLQASATTNPVSLSPGIQVIVHYGMRHVKGVILHRGFGRYENEYRVQFAWYNGRKNGDAWVDCWRCVLANDSAASVWHDGIDEWWDHSGVSAAVADDATVST